MSLNVIVQAINPAKRQYVTEQISIVQNDVYAMMRNCAVPYCTNTSPATTTSQLYLTYHDYSISQSTSNGNRLEIFTCMLLLAYNILRLYALERLNQCE
jgi:hypothetical protein